MYIMKIDLSIKTGNEIATLILTSAPLAVEPVDVQPDKLEIYVEKFSGTFSIFDCK
jgi:hypothetical protein